MQAIKIIVAMSNNHVIGVNNRLPWHITEDLKRFKKLTSGHSIIMGRKTFESIGKLLPNRVNIILTKNPVFKVDGAIIAHSFQEAIEKVNHSDIFIIGGAEIYEQAFPLATHLLATFVDTEITGDAFFPKIDYSEWSEVSRINETSENGLKYSFVDFLRINLSSHNQHSK
ncbi:MAG: dihydrofolate reductase [Methylophilaceae bacterium]|nr:dihydrofolate reductase [Methylophilaceae bacterium]MBL6726655.1 dihydrofolate reductase [Methylophilaceae bacterium]MBL6728973.1 dihydrofolate reductase [Methylophilaceae bacterium]MBL6791223.1 dihydrofolate reductase [Methylophilaceae bacterium]